jgi:hypothetical protein
MSASPRRARDALSARDRRRAIVQGPLSRFSGEGGGLVVDRELARGGAGRRWWLWKP